MGNALEQEIIDLYSNNPSSLYSINQIARKLGKTYPYINKKVTFLVDKKIFHKTIVGRSHLCSLNLHNDETVYLLILNEITRKQKFMEGSRAAHAAAEYAIKVAKASGASLAIRNGNRIIIVAEKGASKDDIARAIVSKHQGSYEITSASKEEFLEMLREDRDLLEDHTILHGFEKYFHLVLEIEDDLKLKYSKII